MQRYEYRLHYWVTCLQRAGSAYAFATLGSVMQLSLPHYAAVRGFPKRNGGEDFYLLNKLNKVGVVQSVHTRSPVILSSRRSHRVPFGTGPGVIDAEQYDTGNYLLPNPIAFDYLMAVQAQLPDLPQTDVLEQPDSRQILKAWSEQVCRKPDTLKADILCAALTKIGMERALVQFKGRFERHRTTVSQPIAAAAAHWWHLWFDAKKQLRLIRELQRHGIAALSLPEVHKQITGQPFTDLTRALQTLRGM